MDFSIGFEKDQKNVVPQLLKFLEQHTPDGPSIVRAETYFNGDLKRLTIRTPAR